MFALSSCATLRRFIIHVRRSFSQRLSRKVHAPYPSRHIASSPNFLRSANPSDMLDDGNYPFISGASFSSLLLRRGDSRIWRNRLEDAVRQAARSIAGRRSITLIRQWLNCHELCFGFRSLVSIYCYSCSILAFVFGNG